MWWHEQVLIWRDLAPFEREGFLVALIPLIDAFLAYPRSPQRG